MRTLNAGMPERKYVILHAGEGPMGGIFELPRRALDADARPGWSGYIGADDIDACVSRLRDTGGLLRRAAEDIPGVGRFAIVADPHGAGFTLFRSAHASCYHPCGRHTWAYRMA